MLVVHWNNVNHAQNTSEVSVIPLYFKFISSLGAYCLKKSQAISIKLLLHSSNLLTVAHMEVKLGAHVYYIVSMTTTTTNSLRQFSLN